MFLLKKNKELIEEIESYFKEIERNLSKFYDAISYVIANGRDNHFKVMVEGVDESEHVADQIRNSIEHTMFSQSLLPETREDLMEIIEEMDKIPGYCEKAVFMVVDQKVVPIQPIKSDIIELAKVCIECSKATIEIARDYLGKMKNIEKLQYEVDNYERLGDKLERKLINKIFRERELSTGDKLIQKDIVREIGDIANVSKLAARRIIIASIKRKI